MDVTKSAFKDIQIPDKIIKVIDQNSEDVVKQVITGQVEVTSEKQDAKVQEEVLTGKV